MIDTMQSVKFDYNLTQYLSGHGNFKCYLYRFKIIDSPKCDCENDEDNVWHRIFNCDMFINRRMQLTNECYRQRLGWPIEPNIIISNKRIFIELLNFIKNIHK